MNSLNTSSLKSVSGTRLSTSRTLPMRARVSLVCRAEQGAGNAGKKPMSEDKQSHYEQQGGAPEADKALIGEKVQMAGAKAPGPKEYPEKKEARGRANDEGVEPAGNPDKKEEKYGGKTGAEKGTY